MHVLDEQAAASVRVLCELIVPGSSRVGPEVYIDAIQGLWSAVQYGVGVLFVVIANGRYGVMDAQASWEHETAPWPRFPGLDISAVARGMGCAAHRVESYAAMAELLGPALERLASMSAPLLIEAVVAADE